MDRWGNRGPERISKLSKVIEWICLWNLGSFWLISTLPPSWSCWGITWKITGGTWRKLKLWSQLNDQRGWYLGRVWGEIIDGFSNSFHLMPYVSSGPLFWKQHTMAAPHTSVMWFLGTLTSFTWFSISPYALVTGVWARHGHLYYFI